MLNCTYPKTAQVSFAHKPTGVQDLPKIRDAVVNTLSRVESPIKLCKEEQIPRVVIQRLEDRLRALRSMLEMSENPLEYFRTLIGGVKAFRVANCSEMAEITKVALKANGVPNCDIYCLYKQKAGTMNPPVNLDQTIVALNIPKKQNNKATLEPFVPSPDTKIIDIWIGNYVGTIKDARPKYESLGLLPGDKLMLRPIKTMEIDSKVLENIKKDFPSLVVEA